MRHSKISSELQDPEVAISCAVRTVTKWVARAWISTATIIFFICLIFYWLDKHGWFDEKPVEVAVGAIISLGMVGLALRFSWDQINIDVRAAINAVSEQSVNDYRTNHPGVKEIENIQLQEYCCISHLQISNEIARANRPNSQVCDRRLGRDAIIKYLAYNDRLLQGIALVAVDDTLKFLNRTDITSKEERELFLADIYAYLKGWLILSITHNHVMSAHYIQQRYKNAQNQPDKRAYLKAIEIAKERIVNSDHILQAFQGDSHSKQAIELLDTYLGILMMELRNSSKT